MTPDIPASIKARLLKRAREQGDQLELVLVRYASERFLYRLGASLMRDRCILKGAGLLTLWMNDPYRATRDIDLLAYGASDEASMRQVMIATCNVPCPEDGVTFDLESLALVPIRAEVEYPGQRATILAYLGKARIKVQVDFAFGDDVVPGPEDAKYPTLLDGMPAPSLRTYPKAVTIAEKFEAMVSLGQRNSRMKDFHDVWALSSEFEFDGRALHAAIAACFRRRGTIWTPEVPDALRLAFYGDPELSASWSAYLRAGAFHVTPPSSFEMIGERIQGFLGPIRSSLVADNSFDSRWEKGGPWR